MGAVAMGAMVATAIHVAVALQIQNDLLPALKRLQDVLAHKAQEWDKIIKIGRTHLADATPLHLRKSRCLVRA